MSCGRIGCASKVLLLIVCIQLLVHMDQVAGQQRPFVMKIGPNRLVSRATFRKPIVEPHLSASPDDPNHLVAAAIVSNVEQSSDTADCIVFTSFDGGITWLQHEIGVKGCVDPWTAIGGDNVAFVAVLGTKQEIEATGALLVFSSKNGGKTWGPLPLSLGPGHDHETILIARSQMTGRERVFVTSGRSRRSELGMQRWPVFIARSDDAGRSFPLTLHITPSNLNLNSDNAVSLPDGTIVVTFTEFHRNVDGFKSRKGLLQRSRTSVIVSKNEGDTFSEPLFVAEDCGPSFKTLAADKSSGPYSGRLYLVCPSREKDHVYLYRSADGGETWTDPIRVNALVGKPSSIATPSLAVNQEGVVGVAWYDRRQDPSNKCYDIYLAVSQDGGETFVPEVRISDVTSCPDSVRNGWAASRWPAGRDYSGLIAAADNRFHVLWSDSRNGIYQTWTAVASIDRAKR